MYVSNVIFAFGVTESGPACAGVDVPVYNLSGGNQQKVVIGRWLIGSHKVYLFDEPTRGVDVGAKFAIYEILREIRDNGAGLLVISSELLELMSLCDRALHEALMAVLFQREVGHNNPAWWEATHLLHTQIVNLVPAPYGSNDSLILID